MKNFLNKQPSNNQIQHFDQEKIFTNQDQESQRGIAETQNQLSQEQKQKIEQELKEMHNDQTGLPGGQHQLESPTYIISSADTKAQENQKLKKQGSSPFGGLFSKKQDQGQQSGFMNAISQSIADTMQNMYLKEQANPAPLGLIGFGMTTLLLNIHNVGAYPTSAMICGMGIFVGGLAQIIAGIFEFIKNNTFGQTAFIGYGCFWLSLVTVWVFPALPNKANTIAPNEIAMGWYLFVWGLYTSIMFFGTLKLNRLLQIVFFTLVLCFFMLAIGKWADNLNCIKAAGWIGIICGSSAMYGAVAQVLNEIYGKTVMPLGQMKVKNVSKMVRR